MHRLQGDPLFFHGPLMSPLWPQYTLYEALLNDVPYHQIRQQFNFSHATLERYADRLRKHLTAYVEKAETEMKVGNSRLEEWEVDECTIAHWPSGDRLKPKCWTDYVGLIQRGSPISLRIYRMECRKTKERSPDQGPSARRSDCHSR
eukprot:2836274-Amphidinium_carterae.1